MKSFKLIAILFLSIIFTSSYAQSLQKQLDKYTPYLTELNVGIGVLVQQNGKTTIANSGTYNFNEHTVFNIGSATKKMTAILLLQEAEKGTLKLSDSIGSYLQPIKNVDGSLSIETLLRHRSGLGELVGKNHEKNFYAKSDDFYNSDFLHKIPENHPEKIGKFNYCNTNYILLGHVLENVTDKSYFDLLQERIFTPCNMTESYPYVSKNLKNLATPIHKKENVRAYLDYRFFANYAYSAGSVASTLNDQVKFYNHLFQQKTLISETSLKQFTAFDDAKSGLGIQEFKNGYIRHGGTNIGYSFRELYNPKDKKLVLFFSNSMAIPFKKLIRKELFNFINGKTSKTTFNKNIASEFAPLIGRYLFDSHGMKIEMEILKKNNHLYLSVQGAEVILISREKNKLYDGMSGVELEVNLENKDELIFRQKGLETTIKRVKS